MRNIIQDMNSEQVLSGITFKWLIQFDFVTSSLGLLPISSFRIVVAPMARRPLEPGMVDGTLSGRNFAKWFSLKTSSVIFFGKYVYCVYLDELVK